jgi:hypothetical protein
MIVFAASCKYYHCMLYGFLYFASQTNVIIKYRTLF